MASIISKSVLLLEHGRLIAKLAMNAVCTRFLVPPVDFTKNKEPVVFYGTQSGNIGIIIINSQMELEEKCLVDGSGLGTVSCLAWWSGPMSCNYLLVGRHDGSVQVFLLDVENFPEKPKLKFSYFCGETVTSVVGGQVGKAELVVSTYSGRIFGLRPQDDAPNSQTNVSSRLAKLEVEVSKLEKLVYQERENYQKTTHATLFTGLSAPPLLALKEELSGMRPDGWQELQMSCATPIDILFLVCTKPITLQTDSASAVLSISPVQENNEFQATVRCQAGMHSIWLKLKCQEQRAVAILKIYVIPAGAPRIARLKTYNLCPLSAYDQYQTTAGIEEELRSWNELSVNGPFSVAEMSAWLAIALPGELPRPGHQITFCRRHTILDTVLLCWYQKGEASFKSNNVTTISVLKELLSNSAIKKNIRIDVHCDINENTVLTCYRQITPKIEYEYNNTKKLFLKNALSELDIDVIRNQETEKLLCDEYMGLIKGANENLENNLASYIDVVIDWFKDFRKLKVQSFNDKDISQLKEALCKNDIKEVTRIITHKPDVN